MEDNIILTYISDNIKQFQTFDKFQKEKNLRLRFVGTHKLHRHWEIYHIAH